MGVGEGISGADLPREHGEASGKTTSAGSSLPPFSKSDKPSQYADLSEASSAADGTKLPADLFATEATGVPSTPEGTDAPTTSQRLEFGGSSGGGGSNQQQAQQDGVEFATAMAMVLTGLKRIEETLDRAEQRGQVERLLRRAEVLVADAEAVLQAGEEQAPDVAFRAMTGHEALTDGVQAVQAAAPGKEPSLWGSVQEWLGEAGKKLWAMISRLVKVKEWTITGTVGTGVFGFTGASISVTFGKESSQL
jgi:hypothetical protein